MRLLVFVTTMLAVAHSAAPIRLPDVTLVSYDAVPNPDLDVPANVDEYLAQWKAANQRIRASAPTLSCPARCSGLGPSAKNWPLYPNVAQLSRCNETVLMDFALGHSLKSKHTQAAVRACVADVHHLAHPLLRSRSAGHDGTCAMANSAEVQAKPQIGRDGPLGDVADMTAVSRVVAQLQGLLAFSQPQVGCTNDLIRFASSGRAVAGIYVGARIRAQHVGHLILDAFHASMKQNRLTDTTMIQLCRTRHVGSDFAFGLVVSLSGNVSYAQTAVRDWNEGRCAEGLHLGAEEDWMTFPIQVPAIITGQNKTGGGPWAVRPKQQPADGVCRTQRVEAGDGCAALAAKCGISDADFTIINPSRGFCQTLVPGQHVCCSRGRLPDLSPKPASDGSCAPYLVRSGDSCFSIAAQHNMTVDEVESYNKKTWGWSGCARLWANINICLSSGSPPLPAPVSNAVCGPTVPGSPKPAPGQQLADLNPCPLNVCCNIWGQCGVDSDFCLISESETGAPGTSKAGTSGCISHCGREIVQTAAPGPAMRIGYFLAGNKQRKCLHMDARDIDTTRYTHVHFAFVDVAPDFSLRIADALQNQFDQFKNLTGIKRIISLGGWAFSTEPATFRILREAVRPANRLRFRDNVIQFLKDHDLDGFDVDWEYPGAPDIPGIPPSDDPQEGFNYYKFLAISKAALGNAKSVSFAAPASFWYLKAFPLKLLAKTVDYIVYMTYDLHGQWDYGNKWSSPGCPSGNCLRSHVNFSETLSALSMITKAGAPSNKVAIGVTSYGRSFHMADANCDGPDCQYTGSATQSDAKKGPCTDTAGYISDAEINDMLDLGLNKVRKMRSTTERSDIIVYDDTEWVAYMDGDNKDYRTQVYDSLHFAGTSDWSLDLQQYREDRDFEPYVPPAEEPLGDDCVGSYESIEAVAQDKDRIPQHCASGYVMGALQKQLRDALSRYRDILDDGYDGKFATFASAFRQTWENKLANFYFLETDQYFDCVQAQVNDGESCKFHNVSIQCPPLHQLEQAFNTYLIPRDDQAILEHLDKAYGVSPDAIQPSYEHFWSCLPDQDRICPCSEWGNLIGKKVLRPDWHLPDPKAAVEAALANMTNLDDFLQVSTALSGNGIDSMVDLVDAMSLPILMVISAVEAMEQIKEQGGKIEEEKRNNIILLALTAVLFVIPGVGEGLAAVSGIAMIARIATIIAEAGGAGLALYDMANNPESAPLQVFGLVMGGLAVRGAARGSWISEAAAARRAMGDVQVRNMGATVSRGLEHIDALVKVCRRA